MSLPDSFLPFLGLGVGTLSLGLILGAVSSRWAAQEGARGSLGRKLFHVVVFTGAVPAQLWLGFWGVVVYGTILASLVALGAFRGERASIYRGLARETDWEGRRRMLLVPLAMTALGGLLSVLLVGHFAAVGYLVCGWGDASGELVGKGWGRRRYTPFFSREGTPSRTYEGSLAVLAAGSLGGWAALALLGYPLLQAILVGIFAGLVGAFAEGVSGGATDNFWVQLLPSLGSWWLLG